MDAKKPTFQIGIGLVALGFLALLVIVLATVWLAQRAQVYSNDGAAARDVQASADELRNALRTAESSQRGFLLTGNQIYLAPFNGAKGVAMRELGKLQRDVASLPTKADIIAKLEKIVSDKFAEMSASVDLKSAGQGDEALKLIGTNKGKRLMDEANIFLSSIVQAADVRLSNARQEQSQSAELLRWVASISGIVIVLVAFSLLRLVLGYTRQITAARDEVTAANETLEQRVVDRTTELSAARDKAEVLLSEVNHRVANSLAIVSSFIRLQKNAVEGQAAKDALEETQVRINAVALAHKRLYSSGNVTEVDLAEYLESLLSQLETSLVNAAQRVHISRRLEPIKLATDDSINLGVVAAEWITNAYKYAYPSGEGEVRVSLHRLPDQRAELVIEDDGVGRTEGALALGTGLGTRIVKAMATNLKARIDYLQTYPGTMARIEFPVPAL